MGTFVEKLTSGNSEEIAECLKAFCSTHALTMKFRDSYNFEEREKIWLALFQMIGDESKNSIHCKCLEALRILSRDKNDVEKFATDSGLSLVIHKANLGSSEQFPTECTNSDLEALKLLCNLIYNSPSMQVQILSTKCLQNLLKKINTYNGDMILSEKDISKTLFEIRIVFLITALNPKSRQVVKSNEGDSILIQLLQKFSEQLEIFRDQSLQEKKIDLICEILKALFNIFIDSDDSTNELKTKNVTLVKVLRKLLLINLVQKDAKSDELQSHIVNLLTVIPDSCLTPMIPPINGNTTSSPVKSVYENFNMTAIHRLLVFLYRRLDIQKDVNEKLSPVVVALLKLCKSHRVIRKFVRQEVLPPLKDVMKRPEEGTTLRAKLCKLLTIPVTEFRDLVAEFLFVLCKENVERMVKYTGYGNAAGMFANKGLLGGKQPETEYSSESDESDTEEYVKYRNDINPVTGCYETPKINPLEGMSEEQKEYEAMKLVNLVSQLTNSGMIRPCTIGDDGKPRPVDHILELQNGISKLPGRRDTSDSD